MPTSIYTFVLYIWPPLSQLNALDLPHIQQRSMLTKVGFIVLSLRASFSLYNYNFCHSNSQFTISIVSGPLPGLLIMRQEGLRRQQYVKTNTRKKNMLSFFRLFLLQRKLNFTLWNALCLPKHNDSYQNQMPKLWNLPLSHSKFVRYFLNV